MKKIIAICSLAAVMGLSLVACGNSPSSTPTPASEPASVASVASEPVVSEPVVSEPVVSVPAESVPAESTPADESAPAEDVSSMADAA